MHRGSIKRLPGIPAAQIDTVTRINKQYGFRLVRTQPEPEGTYTLTFVKKEEEK